MCRGLIIHHWDADGISSAALLLKHVYPEYENWTPNRGIRRLDQDHIEWLVDFDHVVITDMAIPKENIDSILESSEVTIIDHHIQKPIQNIEFINPIGRGKNVIDYPCTSWVIKEHFDLPVSLLVIIGLIGDRLHKADENPLIWSQIEKNLENEGTRKDELYFLTRIVDSLHKIGDIEAVIEAPKVLQDESPETIKKNMRWRKAYNLVESELERILSESLEIRNEVIYKELDTKLNIVSEVAKKLSWSTSKDIVAVNRGYFTDRVQIYSRSTRIDLLSIMLMLQSEGYFATGKQGVLGTVLPISKSNQFIDYLMQRLCAHIDP